MAIMQAADRQVAAKNMMDEIRKLAITFNLAKPDLQATVDAVDQWISDNAVSYNSAIPVAARTLLTAPQKAALLMVVLERRYLVGA